jgi:hypothetical protein
MLDFSQDYKIWDNRETVRYISTRRPGPDVEQDIDDGCIKQQVESPEAVASGGVYINKDVHWFIPGVLIGQGVLPKAADKIRDASGSVWTVLRPWFEDLDQVWDLICRNPVIAFDLKDLIDVWTPNNRADEAAGRVPDFEPAYQNIAARMQADETSIDERHGGRFITTRFNCHVAEQLDVRPGEDQIRFVGDVYEIETITNPDRIGELMTLGLTLKG